MRSDKQNGKKEDQIDWLTEPKWFGFSSKNAHDSAPRRVPNEGQASKELSYWRPASDGADGFFFRKMKREVVTCSRWRAGFGWRNLIDRKMKLLKEVA
jgi:hypothetical protein